MTKTSPTIVLAAIYLCGFFAISVNAEDTASPFAGRWQSKALEDLGNNTYSKREFNLQPKRWEIVFTLFLDKEGKKPVFSFRGVGPYEVQGKSETVAGASNAIFRFRKKYVTLRTSDQETIKGFGMADCNLEPGVEKDITETGCSFLPSVKDYGQEYDLLKLDGDTLYFGARPADSNLSTEDRRPKSLGEPLVKQSRKP